MLVKHKYYDIIKSLIGTAMNDDSVLDIVSVPFVDIDDKLELVVTNRTALFVDGDMTIHIEPHDMTWVVDNFIAEVDKQRDRMLPVQSLDARVALVRAGCGRRLSINVLKKLEKGCRMLTSMKYFPGDLEGAELSDGDTILSVLELNADHWLIVTERTALAVSTDWLDREDVLQHIRYEAARAMPVQLPIQPTREAERLVWIGLFAAGLQGEYERVTVYTHAPPASLVQVYTEKPRARFELVPLTQETVLGYTVWVGTSKELKQMVVFIVKGEA